MIRWLAVAAIATTAYLLFVAPFARRIDATQTRASELYAIANHNEIALRDAPALREARFRVTRDVRALGGRPGEGVSLIALMQSLREESARWHVTVKEASEANRTVADDTSERLSLTLHGNYENVVRAVASLSTGRALLDVGTVSLTQSVDDFGLPGVDAVVDVTLYTNPEAALLAEKENQRASVVR